MPQFFRLRRSPALDLYYKTRNTPLGFWRRDEINTQALDQIIAAPYESDSRLVNNKKSYEGLSGILEFFFSNLQSELGRIERREKRKRNPR